ncbi:MAG: hypothetical protein EBZ58_13525 [Bacteroidetes bacterium]|nr:hypothetical protein [Bacteroidota bacterium]
MGHHSKIDDHNFITSHVVISGGVHVEEACFIGVNATIRNHIKIGKNTIIGAGALILSNVEPEGIYKGSETVRLNISSLKIKNI